MLTIIWSSVSLSLLSHGLSLLPLVLLSLGDFFFPLFFFYLDLISNFYELLFFDHSFFIVICAVLWMKYPLYICLKFHFRFLRYFYFLWSCFLLLQSFWCQWLSSNVWWSLVICLYVKWVSNRFYKLSFVWVEFLQKHLLGW